MLSRPSKYGRQNQESAFSKYALKVHALPSLAGSHSLMFPEATALLLAEDNSFNYSCKGLQTGCIRREHCTISPTFVWFSAHSSIASDIFLRPLRVVKTVNCSTAAGPLQSTGRLAQYSRSLNIVKKTSIIYSILVFMYRPSKGEGRGARSWNQIRAALQLAETW